MLCEDQAMAVDPATPLKGALSLNSSSSSISMDAKPLNSWAQEVRAELGQSDETSSSLNSSAGSTSAAAGQMKREIAIEFLDGSNEEKFERLIKEEKIKTPFKRRHSQTPPSTHSNENSRSNSPNGSTSSNPSSNNNNDNQPNPYLNSRQVNQASKAAHKEGKRMRHNSYTSSTSSSSSYTEGDPAVLSRRQKQIDYGKNTATYERYVDQVARNERTRDHPRTPNKYGKYSRRAFDGLVKIWRKQLHFYDPPSAKDARSAEADSDSDSD
ncbi:histone RNA hairpin-binding protein [Drosophila grimshawi]|uniref:GH23223 n=1 Tax=Drosophila grimshawi TaxID=7222 RepID=B4K1C5_DROGR|nr:histone RNA hairpin-binding protein [Drosophila grimshawi]EDW04488.1 GH23223 [Drosophila grimshawi]